jgi:hypothetical protein
VAICKSLSSSNTFASRDTFSRTAVWEASRAVVSTAAATVLALSAASFADAAAAWSLSISASASVSLDASESHSVAATAAAVSAEMARSSARTSHSPQHRLPLLGPRQVHLQLGPLCAELAHLAGTFPT